MPPSCSIRQICHRSSSHGEVPAASRSTAQPRRHFYIGLWLQFVRFDGDSRTAPVLDRQEYEGDVLAQLRALETIEQHLLEVTLPGGREVIEYPTEAIREMVINAIMHRDFDQGSPILFYWFNNRIEVLDAGGLMSSVSPEVFSRHGPAPGWTGRRTEYRHLLSTSCLPKPVRHPACTPGRRPRASNARPSRAVYCRRHRRQASARRCSW